MGRQNSIDHITQIEEFLKRHPYPEIVGVHPIWWAKRLEKTLKCKNAKDAPECRTCQDYDKQYMKCFVEGS